MRPRIKICGITNLSDALAIAELGVDALGFVFAESPRRITLEKAEQIIKRLPLFVTPVGVFVDMPLQEVQRIIEHTGIKVVQLHGSESPDYCNALTGVGIIKTIKVSNNTKSEGIRQMMKGYNVHAFILDPGKGTGITFDWSLAKNIEQRIIIAGGLKSENVSRVIKSVKPYGVDVCSGVEEYPGKKDICKVKKFIKEVMQCCSVG